jgi:hypothetical protein
MGDFLIFGIIIGLLAIMVVIGLVVYFQHDQNQRHHAFPMKKQLPNSAPDQPLQTAMYRELNGASPAPHLPEAPEILAAAQPSIHLGTEGRRWSENISFDFDVFVSFDPADQEWVAGELLPRLHTAGIKTAISEAIQETPVSSIPPARWFQSCRRVIAIISPAYLANRPYDLDTLLRQRNELRKDATRFIPVVIEPSDLPPFVGRYLPVDLTTPGLSNHRLNRLVDMLTGPLELE